MSEPVFTGICPALPTLFDKSGRIDRSAMERLIEQQILAGVDALCICGTTGEASTLSPSEYTYLVKLCVDRADGRVPVIAGAGSNDTSAALELCLRAQDQGADALLLVTPYYNKTSQRGLIAHYQHIARQVARPIILYNVPGRTGLSFTAETYQTLSQDPKICGVKEASGDLALVTKTRRLCPERFSIWSGNDDQLVPLMALGAKGCISVACNIIPQAMADMSHLCLQGEFHQARQLQIRYSALIEALFCEVSPIPLKAAMGLLGAENTQLRLPLCQIGPEGLARLTQALSELGLYPAAS